MLKITRDMLPLFDLLEVGISLLTWDPEDLEKMEWVYVNDVRCAMAGFSREEIITRSITVRSTPQARSIYETHKAAIAEHGQFSCRTKLLRKDLRSIPIMLHLKLVELDGVVLLLSELHDISRYKRTERELQLSRKSLNEMLSLMAREKAHITDNIQDNLGRIVFPLVDQLRLSATASQKDILDLMTRRIADVCREAGIPARAHGLGANLTRRQVLICEMVRDGMTSKEIARILDCSASTVNNHRNAIRRKLKLSGSQDNLQAYLNGLNPST